jgi:hypothetical protein
VRVWILNLFIIYRIDHLSFDIKGLFSRVEGSFLSENKRSFSWGRKGLFPGAEKVFFSEENSAFFVEN